MFPNTNFPGAKKYWHMGKLYDWTESPLPPHESCPALPALRPSRASGPTRLRGTAIFRLPEHIDRFLHSASVLRMTPPYSKEEIIETARLVVRENGLESAYVRPLMFYGYGNLGLIPSSCPVELLMAAWEWGRISGRRPRRASPPYILSKRRVHHSQLDMRAKLGGVYVQSTMYGMEARAEGYDEAIFLNLEGNVAEGPGENLFLVKDGVVKTNDRSESILEGITRTSVLEIARATSDIRPPSGHHQGGSLRSRRILLLRNGRRDHAPHPCRRRLGPEGPEDGARHRLRGARPRRETAPGGLCRIVRGADPKYETWLTYVK